MTPGWVENLSDGPKIVHGSVFYINLEFETCGAGIWEKKINLGPSTQEADGLKYAYFCDCRDKT